MAVKRISWGCQPKTKTLLLFHSTLHVEDARSVSDSEVWLIPSMQKSKQFLAQSHSRPDLLTKVVMEDDGSVSRLEVQQTDWLIFSCHFLSGEKDFSVGSLNQHHLPCSELLHAYVTFIKRLLIWIWASWKLHCAVLRTVYLFWEQNWCHSRNNCCYINTLVSGTVRAGVVSERC